VTLPESFSSAAPEPALTFRDPAGQLHLTADDAIRRIRPEAAEEVRAFLVSPLRRELESSGDLIPSKIADPSKDSENDPGELWLRHPRIDPISYPWEWTPAQWRAAAELTLRLAGKAIDAGWTLKDATPLNVLFSGSRPVFVDVLSFEPSDPHSTVWLAYGQFVRTFLLPLVAAKYLGWPLQASFFWRDGYEPDALYRALPGWRRLDPRLADVVTLAALLERKRAKPRAGAAPPPAADPKLARHILHKRFARLGKQIRHAAQIHADSVWSRYEQRASHYSADDMEAKQQFVRQTLDKHRPRRVLDIGANTGTYSLLAADAGAEVVALDSDTAAVETLWRTAAAQQKPITALVANIARPSPAAGWKNCEQLSLLERLMGRFDMVLLLAVIHHLILREQVPLSHIAELCAGLTRRWLVVEWVPASDPMFQEWLRGRDALYGHLTESSLTAAFAPLFRVVERSELANMRTLVLFERIPDHAELSSKRSGAA